MTTRHRRLVGRARRRYAKGLPVRSDAVRAAHALEHAPLGWAVLVAPILEAWEAIRSSLAAAWDVIEKAASWTQEEYTLMPPPQPPTRHPAGPLLHNGRKPR